MNDTFIELKKWKENCLDDKLNFRDEFLASSRWLVLPIESGAHFDDSDIEHLVAVLHNQLVASIHAMLIDPLATKAEPFIEFEATETGFKKFNLDYGHISYALLPQNLSFAIICTTNDYFLLAGPEEFVRSVVQVPIEEARRDFDNFANDDSWMESERNHLQNIADRYRMCPFREPRTG